MYNTINKTDTENQNKGFVIEKLTRDEVAKLKKVTTGYGKIRGFSREVGIHENTLRDVLLKGSGRPETIRLVRDKLPA
jgi:lambda repressor-like predicted transcriptional regulator